MPKLYNLGSAPILDVTPSTSITPPPTSYKDSKLGTGRNSVTGRAALAGVDFEDTEVADIPNISTSGFIHLVERRSELHEYMGLAASASFSAGPYASDAKVQLSRSLDFSASSVYLFVSLRHTLKTLQLRRARIIPEGIEMLKADAQNQFVKTFGDQYCIETVIGGDLYAVVEFQTVAQSVKSELIASLKGSVGAFSGSAELTKRLSRTDEELVFKLAIARYGSSSPIPSGTKFFDYVLRFPQEIEQNGGTELPTTPDTYRYYSDAMYPPTVHEPKTLKPQRDVLEALAKHRTEIEVFVGQYQRLVANPVLFVESRQSDPLPSDEDLADPIGDAQAKIQRLQAILGEYDALGNSLIDQPTTNPPQPVAPDLEPFRPLPYVLEKFVPRCTVRVHYGASSFEGKAGQWIDMGSWLKGIDVLISNDPKIVSCDKQFLYWTRPHGLLTQTVDSAWATAESPAVFEHGITGVRMALKGPFKSYYTIAYQVRTTQPQEYPEAQDGGTAGTPAASGGHGSAQIVRIWASAARAILKLAV